MLKFICSFTILIVVAHGAIELGCSTSPLPRTPDGCPPGTTNVTDGCCPDSDTYIVTPSTTPTPTTVTTAPPCQDKINPATGTSDCQKRAYLCTDPTYKKMMKDQCPKTCEYCTTGPTTTAPKCSDKINPNTGTSDCPKKKYLCTDPTYKGLMKDQCPKTCGYC
ncbi:hypothetical protein B9Z55_018140 [Caenorhabditis nigoni]|uniref:ShKT domain-containing protein n=1 Tax=Caenorhabditis nigoni TaxID=1611254 RepID=A0A2G5TDA4_9PELO|nr:hypothetical protein B9Z55_018140 [Caenorhabditis nigoni]